MRLNLKLLSIIIPSTSVLVFIIYSFQSQINEFLNWDNAQNPLLIIVILVEAGAATLVFLQPDKNGKIDNVKKLKVSQN